MIEGLKPYSAYKDSGQEWLGDVPSHWDLKPGHVAYKGKSVLNKGLTEGTVLSLSYGRIKVKPSDKQHGLVPKSYATHQIIADGNIVIRGTDLQNDKTSRRIGLSHNRGVISSAYICLETRNSVLECPATFVPVEMRQTGMRGTGYGTREEAYGGADRESAATG